MIYNLQALRALAALLVVTHHLNFIPRRFMSEAWLLPGHTGVDIFFVISGFVMVHTLARQPTGAAAFAENRVVRVVPLYWLSTLAITFLALFLGRLHGRGLQPADLLRSLAFVPYNADGYGIFPVLFVGWTLNYEMAFYALMTVAIAVTGRRLAAMVALVCAVLAVAAVLGHVVTFRSTAMRFYTGDITLEFGAGMVLALAYHRGLRVPRVAAVALAVGGFVMLMIMVTSGPVDRGLGLGAPALALVSGAVLMERNGWALRDRATQLLGAASYALYLVHPFVIALLVADPANGYFHGGVGYVLLAVVAVVASIAAALALHLLIERPLTRWLRQVLGHRPVIVDRATAPG